MHCSSARGAAFFLALVVGLGFATQRGKISGRAVAWALGALMVIDLWTIERLYWMFSPPAKIIYASDPIVEMLKSEAQPIRVLPLQLAQSADPDPFSHRRRSDDPRNKERPRLPRQPARHGTTRLPAS